MCFRVGGSCCWPRLARLRKSATILAILTYLENSCFHALWILGSDESLTGQDFNHACFVDFVQWRVTDDIYFLMWNEIYNGVRDNLLPSKAALIASLNFRSFTGPRVKIRTQEQIRMFWIESCAKQQILINDLSEKRSSVQIPIKTVSDFRWWCTKARKTWRCLAWFWIDSNQSLQPNRSQMKCYVWKPYKDLDWLDELRFSIKRFLSNLLLKIVIYCVKDQTSMTRFQRSAVIFKFSVLTFLKLMSCLGEVKIFQLQPLSNVKICNDKTSQKVYGPEFWCVLSDFNIQLEQSDNLNDNSARKKSVQAYKIWQFIQYRFFL